MNGVHDMGGMHGFGAVEPEAGEPVFHQPWEARTFALRQACGALGKWNIDMSRHANERMPPEEYLPATYYERWLDGLQRLLLESRSGYPQRTCKREERAACARWPGRIRTREGGCSRARWA